MRNRRLMVAWIAALVAVVGLTGCQKEHAGKAHGGKSSPTKEHGGKSAPAKEHGGTTH